MFFFSDFVTHSQDEFVCSGQAGDRPREDGDRHHHETAGVCQHDAATGGGLRGVRLPQDSVSLQYR